MWPKIGAGAKPDQTSDNRGNDDQGNGKGRKGFEEKESLPFFVIISDLPLIVSASAFSSSCCSFSRRHLNLASFRPTPRSLVASYPSNFWNGANGEVGTTDKAHHRQGASVSIRPFSRCCHQQGSPRLPRSVLVVVRVAFKGPRRERQRRKSTHPTSGSVSMPCPRGVRMDAFATLPKLSDAPFFV